MSTVAPQVYYALLIILADESRVFLWVMTSVQAIGYPEPTEHSAKLPILRARRSETP